MPPKSIWRGPKAQHFTLVHRSQQDPLLLDADASQRVLKATPRKGEAGPSSHGGQSRAQLERELGTVADNERKNVGEAAQYGVYFDDTQYDYMQHLRAIGGNDNSRRGGQDEEREEEVIMLEAPKPKQQSQQRGKGKGKDAGELEFKDRDGAAAGTSNLDLPAEVLPSDRMMPRTFEEDRQMGIRPDMDPHLRQVLEALDDDAFLMRTAGKEGQKGAQPGPVQGEAAEINDDEGDGEEEDIDDFFGDIVGGGELDTADEEPEWHQLPPGGEESIWLDPSARAARELLQLREEGKGVEDLSLESRVALFKKAASERQQHQEQEPAAPKDRRQRSVAAPSSTGSKSIFGEKGATRKSKHPGAKARLAGSFYAPSADGGSTAFSMSSSAMERNSGLTGLDEQFERMERIYEQDDDDEEAEMEGGDEEEEEEDAAPSAQVDAIFDEFLAKNEVIGKRMRERLGDLDTTSVAKVDMLRQELGGLRMVDKSTWDEAEAEGRGPAVTVEELISRDLASRKQMRSAWDVETVQTTKTNLENHPRTIAASHSVAPSRVSRIVPGGANSTVGSTSDRMARVKVDPRTGNAKIAGYMQIGARQARREAQRNSGHQAASEATADSFDSPDDDGDDDDDDDSLSDGSAASHDTATPSQQTIKRDRNESKDEKKLRKQAAKEEKQQRKADKAVRKAHFKAALQRTTPPGAALPKAASVALR